MPGHVISRQASRDAFSRNATAVSVCVCVCLSVVCLCLSLLFFSECLSVCLCLPFSVSLSVSCLPQSVSVSVCRSLCFCLCLCRSLSLSLRLPSRRCCLLSVTSGANRLFRKDAGLACRIQIYLNRDLSPHSVREYGTPLLRGLTQQEREPTRTSPALLSMKWSIA